MGIAFPKEETWVHDDKLLDTVAAGIARSLSSMWQGEVIQAGVHDE